MLESSFVKLSQSRRGLLIGVVVTALFTLGTFYYKFWSPRSGIQPGTIGGPFTLTAGNGRVLTDRDVRGKWLLVYFGYTHCPDICPTTLTEIGEALELLGPLSGVIQPLFITIDPERDTPEVIGSYLEAFDTHIIGLTGTPAEIGAVAKKYHVYFAKRSDAVPDGESYLMEHTAFVYVMRPDGTYATLLSPLQGQTPGEMAARLREFISEARSGDGLAKP
jgi:protein SCO1